MKTSLVAAGALYLAFVPTLFSQTTLAVGTFYQEVGAGTTPVTLSGDADTLTFTMAATPSSANRLGVVALLSQPVSLAAEGDFIQVVSNYSGTVGNNNAFSIRFGFFDSLGLTLNEDFDADFDTLPGFFGALATRSTSGANSNHFAQASNAASTILGLNNSNVTGGGVTAIGSNISTLSTGNRTITYRIERIVGDELQFTLSDGASVNLVRTIATSAAPTTKFDTLAVGVNLSQGQTATFDQLTVTASVIPEPALLPLMLGLGAVAWVVARRRRR